MGVNLAELAARGVEYALEFIRSRYERPDNYLPFHNTKHTISGMQRAEKLARAVGLSEDYVVMTRLLYAFHDSIWEWESYFLPDGRIIRKGMASNEEDSAEKLIYWLNSTEGGHLILADFNNQFIYCTMRATKIDCLSVKDVKVTQHYLFPDSHPIIRCIALADLGTAGMDGKMFLSEGDERFWETQLDILHATVTSKKRSDISREKQEEYKERMLIWSRNQIRFVVGRQHALEAELGNLSEEAKHNVRLLFNQFEMAANSVETAISQRQNQDFWFIASHMGQKISAH